MKTFKVLSVLLSYPQAEWIDELGLMEALLEEERERNRAAGSRLEDLFRTLRTESLLELEQAYVAIFDRNPSNSLYLFEHVHGESRERGSAMINLLEEYRKHGLDMNGDELPDYVPLFLEYLSLLPDKDAMAMLGEAVAVLASIGHKLNGSNSPYHAVFSVLEGMSPVAAQPLREVPVREMDETLVEFGAPADGTEPLMVPKPQTAIVRMPRSHRAVPPHHGNG